MFFNCSTIQGARTRRVCEVDAEDDNVEEVDVRREVFEAPSRLLRRNAEAGSPNPGAAGGSGVLGAFVLEAEVRVE